MHVRIIAAALLPGAMLLAEEPPPLNQAEMQQLLQSLRTDYARPEPVNYETLNRHAIAGLLKANPHTMQLVTVQPVGPPAAAPLLVESLTPRIACVRPGVFDAASAAAMGEALTKLAGGETAAVILDLRVPSADGDPAAVTAFVQHFLPKGTALFSNAEPVTTAADPVWTRDLLVLVDGESGNVAEILAAVLQRQRRAVLAGAPTRGRTAAVQERVLRQDAAGTLLLRFTGRPVTFSTGADPFGKGLIPDMATAFAPEQKAAVFALQAKSGLAGTVFIEPRPRLNEAALVQKTNPELPGRIARSAGQAVDPAAAPADQQLQLAVDVLVARQALDAAKK